MPASYFEYFDSFENVTGSDGGAEETYYGRDAGGFDDWYEIFSETGISYEDSAQEIEAWEMFLWAFYPEEGLSNEDWQTRREEFYELTGITDQDIDWEAWREAMGYRRD